MRLSTRRVRKLRKYIARNRCPNRVTLHVWEPFYYVADGSQFVSPVETGLRCTYCGEKKLWGDGVQEVR